MRVAALVGPEFEDTEFSVPYERLRKAGHEVVVIGLKKGETLKGKKGREEATIEAAIDEVRAESFDALFIPGGHSPDHLRADDRVVGFVTHFRDKPIFAICHGPQLLISAGMTEGRTMTAWKTVQVDLGYAGAKVVDKEVVVDGKIVTSRKPDDVDAFVRESLRLLENGASVQRHA
jgi:protease I